MKKITILILAALATAACDKNKSDNGGDTAANDNPHKSVTMTESYKTLSAGNLDLAFSLFAAVNEAAGETATPVVISPLSAGLSLGMLANGAAGETLDEILSTAGAESLDSLNDYCRTLVNQLPDLDKTTTLKVANSVWTASDLPVLESYTTVLDNYYNAGTHTLDPSTASSDINAWCDENTDGLIRNFYTSDDISSDIRAILLNALYFKGEWEEKFDKDDTFYGTFTNYDGSESTVSYMKKHDYVTGYCYECDTYSVMTFPFGNNAFTMKILLPNEGISLSDCVSALDSEEYGKWKYTDPMEFDVEIPKFSVDYKNSLANALMAIGLNSPFSDNADFSAMSSGEALKLTDVKQETVFSIDEDGAEASSVTSSEMGVTDPGPMETGEFHVDRPFLYIVNERSTDTILFIGRVTKL